MLCVVYEKKREKKNKYLLKDQQEWIVPLTRSQPQQRQRYQSGQLEMRVSIWQDRRIRGYLLLGAEKSHKGT